MRIPAIPVAAAAALCLVQCLLPTATEAQAEKRVALVIGNGEYKNAAPGARRMTGRAATALIPAPS